MTENPLSQEQIQELNELAKLPIEEQKEKLQEFLKELSPEQIEFLKRQQQGGGCVFCGIAEGKIPSKKVYEDDLLIGVLDINPANKGHVVLFPKKHYEILGLMEDVGHLFNVANKISKSVFEKTKAEGSNILVSNGAVAGQRTPHASVHIIPRFSGDKVKLEWKKAEVSEEEMDELAKELKEQISPIEVLEEKVEEELVKEEKLRYKQRIP